MADRIIGEVEVGVADLVARDLRDLWGVTRSIVARDTTTLKNRLRRRVLAAGLGQRLANAIRSEVKTTEDTIAGRVFSKGQVKGRPGGTFDLITLFWEGASVMPRSAGWLAIPTDKVKNRRETPASFGPDFFQIVTLGATAMLVPKAAPEEGPYFFLVRGATIKSFYDLEQDIARAGLNLAARIDQEWGRRLVARATRRAA